MAKKIKIGKTPEKIRFAFGTCSLGRVLVAVSEKGICAVFLGDDPDALVRDLKKRFPKVELVSGDRDFASILAKVVRLIESPKLGLDVPLDLRGTVFQQKVWRALGKIRLGSTASYTEIAKRINVPGAVRAVAQACGANKVAVAIPCHRVLRNNGELSGYRWGVERKQSLLAREGA